MSKAWRSLVLLGNTKQNSRTLSETTSVLISIFIVKDMCQIWVAHHCMGGHNSGWAHNCCQLTQNQN